MVIYRLLQATDPSNYCVISQYKPENHDNDFIERLPGKYFRIRAYHALTHGLARRGWLSYIALFTAPLVILLRAAEISKILRQRDISNVVACTGGDLLDLPATYFAARRAGARFHIYMFDRYSDQWRSRGHWLFRIRFLGRIVERFLVRGAIQTIAPNEQLQSDLEQDYGVKCTVIHNPCDLSQYSLTDAGPSSKTDQVVQIVYTGAIYDAHFDAFERLLDALDEMPDKNIQLHVYTAEALTNLKEHRISTRAHIHAHKHPRDIPSIQQHADILFLPLAFNSPYPAIIRTSSPGKMGEYLAAGRPILVHAPRESFAASYFRKHECGIVVDEPATSFLIRAIESILSDSTRAARLSARAMERARTDFDITVTRNVFFASMADKTVKSVSNASR